MAGKKVPICGGSDYHRNQLFLFPGGPTTCVHAMSASPADILAALTAGSRLPDLCPQRPHPGDDRRRGPSGRQRAVSRVKEIDIAASGLLAGDVLQVTTGRGSTPLLKAGTDGKFEGTYTMESAGFARVEILRGFVPGLPLLPALISNPIYFEAE